MSIFRDSIGLILNRVILVFVVFTTDIIVSRYLGPEYKGYYILVTLIPFVLAGLASAGLDYGLNTVAFKDKIRGNELFRQFSSAITICLVFSFFIIIILHNNFFNIFGWLYRGLETQHSSWIPLSLAIIPFYSVYIITVLLSISVGRVQLLSTMRLIFRGFILIGGITLLIYKEMSLTTAVTVLLLANIAGIVFGSLITIQRVGYRFQPITLSIKRMLSSASRAIPNRLTDLLQTRINLLMLGMLASAGAVGIYSVALGIAEGLFMVSGELAFVFFSRDVLQEREEHQRVIRLFSIFFPGMALMAGLISIIGLPMLYGSHFQESVVLIWLLLPGTVFLSMAHIILPYFVQIGHTGQISIARVMGLGINILLNIILIPLYGARLAAVASSLSCALMAFYLFWVYKKNQLISWKTLFIPNKEDFNVVKEKMLDLMPKFITSRVN